MTNTYVAMYIVHQTYMYQKNRSRMEDENPSVRETNTHEL